MRVLHRVGAASPEQFVHLTTTAYAHDDAMLTAYARAGEITAILPMHLRGLEAELADPRTTDNAEQPRAIA